MRISTSSSGGKKKQNIFFAILDQILMIFLQNQHSQDTQVLMSVFFLVDRFSRITHHAK